MLQTTRLKKTVQLFILAFTVLSIGSLYAQSLTVSPSSLFFSTTQNQPSITQKFSVTVSGFAADTKTQIIIPKLYEVPGTIGPTGGTIILTGNATVIVSIRFAANATAGNYTDSVSVRASDSKFQSKITLKTSNLNKPVPVVNPSKLTGFTAVKGGAISPAQSFDLSITGMPTQGDTLVTVKAPKGYLVSLSNVAGTFLQSFVLFAKNGAINTKVFVIIRNDSDTGVISGNVSITGTHIQTKTVAVSGTVTAKPQPTLAVDKTSLSGFNTTTFKASATQSYVLTATNLSAGVSASVTAPIGYEISLSGTGPFSSSLTIAQNTGSIKQQVFVRLKSQSTTGTITGIVTNVVAGLTKNVNVSGTVSPSPTSSVNPTSLSGFSTIQNQPGAVKTYTFVASNLATGDQATVTAPANYEVREQGKSTFASSITLSQTSTSSINTIVEVRIKAGTITGTVSGFIQNSIDGIVKTVSVTGTVSAAAFSAAASELTIQAFPNPFANHFSVKFKAEAGKPALIRLINIQGKVVLEKKYNTTSGWQQIGVDVPKDINGIYQLETNIDGKKKIVSMIRQ